MENTREELLAQVVEAFLHAELIVQRKMLQDFVKVILDEVGADFAPHHLAIMKVLRETGESPVSQVAEATGITKSQMTNSIDKLIASDMVERRSDTEDRRKIYIALTQQGNDMLAELDRTTKSRAETLLSTMNDHELEKLAEAFHYIIDAFSRLQ